MTEPPKRPKGRPPIQGPRLTGPDVAQVSLRLPRPVHAALLAEAERRAKAGHIRPSLNSLIVELLADALEAPPAEPAAPAARKRAAKRREG